MELLFKYRSDALFKWKTNSHLRLSRVHVAAFEPLHDRAKVVTLVFDLKILN